MTIEGVCRVRILTGRSATVDLVLPRQLEIAEMLPVVVDLAGEQITQHQRWRLSRLDGAVLDESTSVRDSGVDDGDVLLLTTETPVLTSDVGDLWQQVAAEADSSDRGRGWSRGMGVTAFSLSAIVAAATLGWTGHASPGQCALAAALVAVGAAVASALTGRLGVGAQPTLILGATAAVFGALAGYLAVPGGPAAPNVFLAASVCSAISVIQTRVAAHGRTVHVAIGAFSIMVAIAAAAAAIWPAPMTTAGALLTVVSLASTTVAARLAILVTGLSPQMPDRPDEPCADEAVPESPGIDRARQGHQTLTGLLAGFSLSAALGAVLVATGPTSNSPWRDVVFTGLVAALLVLRATQQRAVVRPTTLLIAGFITCTATFARAAACLPGHAVWMCLIALALGAGALWSTHADVGNRLTPVARRGIGVFDSLAVAAVLPLACWIGGVFTFVRELSLR